MRAGRRATRVSLLSLAVLLAGRAVLAGGVRELEDAWLTPSAALRAVLGDDAGSRSRWQLDLAQGSLYGLPELAQVGVALDLSRGDLHARVGWQRLGRELYREDTAAAEVRLGGRWQVGLRGQWRRLALAGEALPAASELQVVATVPLGGAVSAEVWWPLSEAPAWFRRVGIRRWLRVGVRGPAAATLAVDRRDDGVPLVQAEVLLSVAEGLALGARTEPWSGTVGLVTAWRIGPVTLRSSHLAHPALGITHRWGVRLGGGR